MMKRTHRTPTHPTAARMPQSTLTLMAMLAAHLTMAAHEGPTGEAGLDDHGRDGVAGDLDGPGAADARGV